MYKIFRLWVYYIFYSLICLTVAQNPIPILEPSLVAKSSGTDKEEGEAVNRIKGLQIKTGQGKGDAFRNSNGDLKIDLMKVEEVNGKIVKHGKCSTRKLGGNKFRFRRGKIDSFKGRFLGSCANVEIDNVIGLSLNLTTTAKKDGWKGEWIKVISSNGKTFTCDVSNKRPLVDDGVDENSKLIEAFCHSLTFD